MKNYWLQQRKKKEVKYRFELIGLFPECDVQVTGRGSGLIEVVSYDTAFGNWLGKAKIGQTNHDAQLKVYHQGKLVETWHLISVEVVTYGQTGSKLHTESNVWITCRNPSTIKSKYFRM